MPGWPTQCVRKASACATIWLTIPDALMIRTPKAGKRAFVVGLLAAAIACGTAASAPSSIWLLRVHARLAPVAGTAVSGRFDGGLVTSVDTLPSGNAALPWRLTWTLTVPQLRGEMTASLRFRGLKTAPPVTRVLCVECATSSGGSMTLTRSLAMRIAKGNAWVVVRTASARLRGAVEATLPEPTA
jgi:hypothetical protein